jgi:hypothetical protein
VAGDPEPVEGPAKVETDEPRSDEEEPGDKEHSPPATGTGVAVEVHGLRLLRLYR